MKKLALGSVIADFSSGIFAQAETAGGAGISAGGTAAAETVLTTSTMLATARVVAAGATAAGAKAESTGTHK